MMNETWPGADETVLCAVSGGLDSMCLLHMLVKRCGSDHVIAAHFNHQLRDLADRDEDIVRTYCADQRISFVSDQGDVRTLAKQEGLSLEEAARKLRYGFLRREAAVRGGIRIYTAHHADDNAETMLLNLVRGTGVTGLAGMRREQNGIYRPLLDLTRADLEAYAAKHGIPHVEDETNEDPDAAARNLLRLRVMPLLKELNPKAVERMNETSRQLDAIDRTLETEAERCIAHIEVREGHVALPGEKLHEEPYAVRPRILLQLFDRLGVGRKDIGAVHLNGILELIRDNDGKERRLDLPHGVTAQFSQGWLVLETHPQPLTVVELMKEQTVRWGDYALTLLDHQEGDGLALREGEEQESPVITVAPCVPGERLKLPGTKGGRSIKRLCLDRRIPLAERDRLPAIYADGHLAGVWKLGVDMEFLPAGDHCRFIQITKETEEKYDEK